MFEHLMYYINAVLVWNNAMRLEECTVFCPIVFPQQSTKGFVINTLAAYVRGLCYAFYTKTERKIC